MGWFNYIGLVIIILILIPNLVFAINNEDGFENSYHNKKIETLEQIGRFGSFILMIFNIPYTYFGFFIDAGLVIYIAVNAIFVTSYIVVWCVCAKRYFVFRAYALSIIPSFLFIFSGFMLLDIPLLLFSVIFAFSHITISVKNAKNK